MKKILIYLFLSLPITVLAQINSDLIKDTATGAGLNTPDNSGATIAATVGTIISVLLSFVGTIFFILVIVSGIGWMTAGGNEDKVSKAKTRLIQAIIGLAITVTAYFITWFISNVLGVAA